ncbi:diacylglycerol kinase family protein [Olivibacter sp. XZL3]|uniref:diacylglycerol/lipid kinase family protein n=1 Tax=Olivibacter sp. XZL3 TaxID=1735116 RepID=UPI001065AEED|nr:diacylglycerol kinase family protein [Olivibacter sp. XZL3]
MAKKRIQFLINPISGGKSKKGFEMLAKRHLNLDLFDASFKVTERANHASELTKQAIQEHVDLVVAVGGDGTINEIAKELLNTPIPLAIVPEGSGNGLARYLGISTDVSQAIAKINKGDIITIDSGLVNGKAFFNVAGMGFDALISDRFAENMTRGPVGYLRIVLNEISKYKAEYYTIHIDGKELQREAFMISIANSPQYGNNAYIAPGASVDDGLLDVCIIKQFPMIQFPLMIYHLFSRTAHQSEYVEIIKGKHIIIERPKSGPVHLDGEPLTLDKKLSIEVLPSSLNVVC